MRRMILRLTSRASAADRSAIDDPPVLLGDGRVDADGRLDAGGGTLPWGALDAGASRLELIDRIVEEYDVDHARAAEGADLYLCQLRHRSLISEH